jgi:hypothetical protein
MTIHELVWFIFIILTVQWGMLYHMLYDIRDLLKTLDK